MRTAAKGTAHHCPERTVREGYNSIMYPYLFKQCKSTKY